jgi:hypothetical protein
MTLLGDLRSIAVPYRQERTRFSDHHSGFYYGTSIKALLSWARSAEVTFYWAAIRSAANSSFVRNDAAATALEHGQNVVVYPSACRDSRDEGGQLTYAGGLDRLNLIRDMQVVDVESDEVISLGSITPLYSNKWTEGHRIAARTYSGQG